MYPTDFNKNKNTFTKIEKIDSIQYIKKYKNIHYLYVGQVITIRLHIKLLNYTKINISYI